MTSEERIKQQKELVESMGRLYDKKGFQPIAGRIIALLTIMDKELYTFDEIVEELQISKSSASNALRMLEISNSIEYTTLPGDRKRYFQIRKRDKFSIIDEHKKQLTTSRDFFNTALSLKANKDSANAKLLQDMIEMMDFFLVNFESIKKEYLEMKN